jgi:hypothetical protein
VQAADQGVLGTALCLGVLLFLFQPEGASGPLEMDSLTYFYEPGTHRLKHVLDNVSTAVHPLKHGDISVEIVLADALESTQEVA